MSTRAKMIVALTENARPGARVAVYADDGLGTIDHSQTIASQTLFRPPSSFLGAWGEDAWGFGNWGGVVTPGGWGNGVWGLSKWGRAQDSLTVEFDVPQALVDLGGPFLFEIDAINPGGPVPIGSTSDTIDVDDPEPTGLVSF